MVEALTRFTLMGPVATAAAEAMTKVAAGAAAKVAARVAARAVARAVAMAVAKVVVVKAARSCSSRRTSSTVYSGCWQ